MHGDHRTVEYSAWHHMLERCDDPKNRCYKHYGGRGIKVSPECREYLVWLSIVGRRPGIGYELERIDNNRGYERGNICWATHKEQVRNRRVTIRVTYNDRTQPLAAWGEELGISYHTMYTRWERGWRGARLMKDRVIRRVP